MRTSRYQINCYTFGKAKQTIYLVKSLLHQLTAVSTLYQGALGRYRRGPKGEEALRGAVAQKAQKGIGLLWLHRLEASEGCDVAGFGSKPHQLLAVFVMDQLLLRDLLHLLTHALPQRQDSERKVPPGDVRMLLQRIQRSPLPPCC